jgi:hypothetical protein
LPTKNHLFLRRKKCFLPLYLLDEKEKKKKKTKIMMEKKKKEAVLNMI